MRFSMRNNRLVEPAHVTPEAACAPFRQDRRTGQALLVVAVMMSVLILFLGLAVDVGNLMARRAKLQSGVDSAALSAAQLLFNDVNYTTTATIKAYQILEANGVASSTLDVRTVVFPADNQVQIRAVQRVDTFFMRLIPLWRTVNISAQATADLNAYAEMNTKPYGRPGVVNELSLAVWGRDSHRRGGDAYSPQYISNALAPNPEYIRMPYGYLYRIDVPPNYPSDWLSVQIFDADSYNRTGTPPPYPTAPGGSTPTGTRTVTPTPTINPDAYASCTNPRTGVCTSNGQNYDTGMKLNAFPSGRPAFWRMDEYRRPTSMVFGNEYNDAYATTTQYTLWHFSPRISSAFYNPATLSDQPGGGYLARYTIKTSQTVPTDLSWYRPPNFNIRLIDLSGNDLYEREQNGGFYFYLYVQGIAGSSENAFDLRVGPPQANHDCSTPCYVNRQYMDNVADWDDGGAKIFAKRALPLNLNTGDAFPLAFTQVSKFAAGQTLGVRHFDQDCNGGCSSTPNMQYQMSLCPAVSGQGQCTNLNDPTCWENIGTGWVGDNDSWNWGTNADPEPVYIPFEGTAQYGRLFGSGGECSVSWLRIQSNPSYSTDTSVWEMPFIRPRLVR